MIQRIQTVYLLFTILCLGGMSFWPIAQLGETTLSVGGPIPFEGHQLEPLVGFIYDIGRLVIMVLALVTMFMFKNRKVQMLLDRITFFLLLIYVVIMQVDLGRFAEQLSLGDNIEYGVSTFLPVAALAFLILAGRGIKKDEELVRSLDRLR